MSQDVNRPADDATADLGENSYRGAGRLVGRRTLITGASSGIGAATAIAYAREGADVTISHLPCDAEDAQRVVRVMRREGHVVRAVAGDLRDRGFVHALVDEAVATMNGLDVVVNRAGRQVAPGHPGEDGMRDTYEVNVLAMFRVVAAALPHLRRGGTVINTTLVESEGPSSRSSDGARVNAVINHLSEDLARRLAPEGIQVTTVVPGPVCTPMRPSGTRGGADLSTVGHFLSVGRPARPVELAPVYVFLATRAPDRPS